VQAGEGVQPLRREATLEHIRWAARQVVPGDPSTNKSGVGSKVLPGERRAGQEVDVDVDLDS
jgi:hypothetical protein